MVKSIARDFITDANLLRTDMNETLHFLMQHGNMVVFVVVLAEQVGLPIPVLPILIAVGALSGDRSNEFLHVSRGLDSGCAAR